MSGSGRLSESERVELMLCVLPWIAARGGASLEDIGAHFGADPAKLHADLDRVFYDVEIGDPMTMVTVDVDPDGFVTVILPGSFEEPPRLDHTEALHLLAAGTAMAALQGASDTLDPALDKLAAALGPRARSAVQVDLGSGDPELRELLRAATREQCRVRLRYFSWGADTVGDRTVDPYVLRSIRGEWYLTGHCHDRGALRHFRLDRVLAAERVGDPGAFEVPDDVPEPLEGFADDTPLVEMHIPARAAWVVDSLPVAQWEESDDGEMITVRIPVSNETWLDRTLLRLPAQSRAVDLSTGDDLMARRAAAASRILDRHAADAAAPGTGSSGDRS